MHKNILSVAVTELFWITVAQFTVCGKLYVADKVSNFILIASIGMICIFLTSNDEYWITHISEYHLNYIWTDYILLLELCTGST